MKIPIIILVIGMVFFQTESNTLEDLKWKKRVILVFPESDDFLMEVSDSLRVEIEIRDIIYLVWADSLYTNGDFEFEEEYIATLEAKYLLGAKTACWVLLGKDGGIKLRKEEELDWNEAFNTIDEMQVSWGLVSW